MKLDSLCKYTVENLEFLDTPTHIYVWGDDAQIQDYNHGTHCECTTNYSFIHVNFVRMLLT